MSTAQNQITQTSMVPPHSLAAFGRHKTALLERANPGIRRATPDSEVLASSDDEVEHSRPLQMMTNVGQFQKPTRRTSWLNEIPSNTARRSSAQCGGPSPNTSLPATPAADLSSWNPPAASPASKAANWSNAAVPSFPWSSTTIWNENKIESSQRHQQLGSSPANPKASSNSLLARELQNPSKSRNSSKDISIPFSIPLHPTPKTYRSQSYSVGQIDRGSPDANAAQSPTKLGRNVAGSQTGVLPRRPSRPSIFSDYGRDAGILGKVREVDDDEEGEESGAHSLHAAIQPTATNSLNCASTFSKNPARAQYDDTFRDRTGSAISVSSARSGQSPSAKSYAPHRDAFGSADIAVDDQDDGRHLTEVETQNVANESDERSSFHALGTNQHSVRASEARNTESAKRAQWQTSLGFDSLPEVSQSRRHSFADIPTRQGSISSTGEFRIAGNQSRNVRTDAADGDEGYGTYSEDATEVFKEHPSHFSGPDFCRPPSIGYSLHHSYANPGNHGRSRHLDVRSRSLFIVTFKCCRADVYYVQEGTGLRVKPGDLVIVEADRGTDLGTVAHSDVPWDQARQMKEQYAEEHYKWLMLFSQQSQSGGPNATNPNGMDAGGGLSGSISAMNPTATHGSQDGHAVADPKPKLIRRLAQNHEIQALRDKEGNEAKAKRVCQSKVAEHRLNMEILDAEFQMDWKKLTFYYFADAYINFNSLVTDLFKIYKTRIWMSAINPASFVTPTSSLNVPPPLTAIGLNHADSGSASGRRRPPPSYSTGAQAAGAGYHGIREPSREVSSVSGGGLSSTYLHSRAPTSMGSPRPHQRPDIPAYPSPAYSSFGMANSLGPPSGAHYAVLDPNAPSFSLSQQSAPRQFLGGPAAAHQDWTARFQGLTLGRS